MKPTYVIAGGGTAAANATEALRGAGFDGRVVVIGEEPHAPYERPPLSKALLRGDLEPDATLLRAPDFYANNAIELERGIRVETLDAARRSLRCSDGREVRYDKLLIATGARPRRLDIPGEASPGVQYLRTIDDALALRAAFASRPRVAVIGTGFIGCEVAATATEVGCTVTLVGPTLPMERVLGSEIGALFAQRHRDRGVVVNTNATIAEIRGDGRVEAVRFSDGGELACDLVVLGVGVVPVTEWLGTQVALSNGVDTDEFCRTSVQDIFAAGDVACSWRPRMGRRARLEHFDNAESQGAAAGRAMHGDTRPYDPIPFFWSDQFDLSLQYYGFAATWDRVVVRGSVEDGALVAFYVADGRVDAACTLNRSQDANAVKRLIGRSDLDPATLADTSLSLKTIAAPKPA